MKEIASWKMAVVYAKEQWTCAYCGKRSDNLLYENGVVFPLDEIGNKYHIDHINPRALGGKNDLNNLCCSCPHCNMSKGKKKWDASRVKFLYEDKTGVERRLRDIKGEIDELKETLDGFLRPNN